jgi:2-polyprenyl-3-methyl-5-hydroxy-6-metoxy-1,4-benzoquinol methylase
MHYDPIKKTLGNVIGQKRFARSVFYRLLDLLLLRAWHIKHVLKKWAHNQQPDLIVLDAGSGFGQYSFWLARKFKSWQITGVDVKQEQVDDCNAFFSKAGKHIVKFESGDLTTYKKPVTFNLILSVDVMEHIEDDNAVFRNFYNSLKPGGMLLISTPSDQGGSDVHDDNQTSFIEEHVRDGYNRLEIQEKLANAGFGRTTANYQYGRPGKISWKLSMKYPIKLLGVSKIFFIILPFYYLLVFPFCLILNYADVRIKHNSGTGLIVRAWK